MKLPAQLVLSLLSTAAVAPGRAGTLPPRADTYAVKERHGVPPAWTCVGAAPKEAAIHLRIGLRQQNPGAVERHLGEISDPGHARYGRHLGRAEIEALVAPAPESREAVREWLAAYGVGEVSHNAAGDTIHCVVSIAKAEELLRTEFATFRHEDGTRVHRAPEWSLPLHLFDHVDLVQPTTSFLNPGKTCLSDRSPTAQTDWSSPDLAEVLKRQDSQEAQDVSLDISQVCNSQFVTLRCLQALYGTIDYVPQVPDQNSIATANYLDETIFKADMSIFMQRFRPDAINAIDEFEEVVIDGGSSEQDVMSPEKIAKKTNREANLDAQYAIGMTWPTNFMGYYTGGSPEMALDADTLENTNEPYLAWLDYVLEQDDLPQVISTSYADLERTVPYSLAKRVCDRFAQLGARGVSVIFASGDHGVGEDNNPACVSNEDGNPVQFIPTFPSSCPWVTSVGGVSGFNPELPANKTFSSGGGFSDYFPRPAYQQQAVQQYLDNLGDQSQGSYNSTGRGYPDVAAQGENMVIVWNGRATMIGGTSAATPVFAAVITLVNDALLAAGKPPLGFLNPWLYREGYQALNDIIGGSNRGCGVDGFPAVEGWDPVTGHGTPNFQNLVALAMNRSVEDAGVAPDEDAES